MSFFCFKGNKTLQPYSYFLDREPIVTKVQTGLS